MPQPGKKGRKDAMNSAKVKENTTEDSHMQHDGPASGSKRPAALVDSDSDLAPGKVTPTSDPIEKQINDKFDEKFDRFFAKLDSMESTTHERLLKLEGAIEEHQGRNDGHFDTMSNSFARALESLADRFDERESKNKAQFADIDLKFKEISDRFEAHLTSAAAASSTSSRPALVASHIPKTFAPNPHAGPQEDCLVFIRGFPTIQPGFVLKAYATEALEILPDAGRKLIKTRVSPADTQFSLVFPCSGSAASFVEAYRARQMVFVDADKNETPLTCRTGKPLALRRRGGLIRPVYSELEAILKNMPSMARATISQTSKTRSGTMTTEFYALIGSKLTALFTLTFKETPEAMTIEQVNPPLDGSALSPADFAKIVQAATSK
jgi:hypothetical protein